MNHHHEDNNVVPPPPPPPTRSRRPHLAPLDGYRFFVAFWLVLAHNFDPRSSPTGGLWERFCVRRYVAVSFFIVLSGFVSHYAYGQTLVLGTLAGGDNAQTLRQFYMSRIGSILPCYLATMVAAVAIRMANHHYTKSYCIQGAILSSLLLQSWIPNYAYYGNTPAWTVSTLVAHWVAYPWLLRISRLSTWSEVTLQRWTAALPLLAILPIIACLAFGGGQLNRNQWYTVYTHPVLRLPDFVYGTFLAEVLVRQQQQQQQTQQSLSQQLLLSNDENNTQMTTTLPQQTSSSWTRKLILVGSDVALPVVLGLILAVPYSHRWNWYDSILMQAPMHLFGLTIYGASLQQHPQTKTTLMGQIMSTSTCRHLGDFSFQVYLWRWPLFALVHWQMELQGQEYIRKGWMALRWSYFIPSLLLLYVWSYAWYRWVDSPLRLALNRQQPRSQVTTSTANILPPQSSPPKQTPQQGFLV